MGNFVGIVIATTRMIILPASSAQLDTVKARIQLWTHYGTVNTGIKSVKNAIVSKKHNESKNKANDTLKLIR